MCLSVYVLHKKGDGCLSMWKSQYGERGREARDRAVTEEGYVLKAAADFSVS